MGDSEGTARGQQGDAEGTKSNKENNKEEKRDSVVFYRSFYEAIKELPSDQKGEIYDAIFEYSLNFREVELSGLNATIFTLIKPQLEANNKKYYNGKKAKKKQTGSKTGANVNANANVNDNVNEYYVPLGFNLLFIEKEFAESFSKWLEYKLEIGDSYKLQRTIEAAYNNLKAKQPCISYFNSDF